MLRAILNFFKKDKIKDEVSDFQPIYHKTKSCPVCHASLMKRGMWWVCSRYPEDMQLLSSELDIPFKRR